MSNTSENIISVDRSTLRYIRAHYLWQMIVLIVVFIVGLPLLFFPSILAVVAAFVAYFYVRRKIWSEFVQEIGKSIGFAYQASASADDIIGKSLAVGHDRALTDVLSGTYKDIPIRMFRYSFTVDNTVDNRVESSTSGSVLAFEATFSGTMPEVFIVSKSRNASILAPGMDLLSIGKHVKLEGDFNRYFYMIVPTDSDVEALQLITPDVMAGLIDKAKDLSFEFFGNKMYMFAPRAINSISDMQKAFVDVEYLASLFKRNASVMRS